MNSGIPSSPGNRSARSPELWLTPIVGLVLLGPLIYHWRSPLAESPGPAFTAGWHMHLREKIALDIGLGAVPLFAAAGVQRLLRAWRWRGWARGLVAGLIGCLFVGVFYYYELYPLSHWFKPYDEGEANVMLVYVDDMFDLAILGGLAVFTSVMATSVLIGRRGK